MIPRRLSEGARESMKARSTAYPSESSTPKPGTGREVLNDLLRWLAEIGRPLNSAIRYFSRSKYLSSQFTAEQHAAAGAEEAGALRTPIENGNAESDDYKTFTVPITADLKVKTPIDGAATIVLDQVEIQRRRDLVRTMFNDFWSGAHEKPAAFVERLNQAGRLSERAFNSEWRGVAARCHHPNTARLATAIEFT